MTKSFKSHLRFQDMKGLVCHRKRSTELSSFFGTKKAKVSGIICCGDVEPAGGGWVGGEADGVQLAP